MNIIIIIIKNFKVLIKEEKMGKNHIRQERETNGNVGWNFSKTRKLPIQLTGRIGIGRPDL